MNQQTECPPNTAPSTALPIDTATLDLLARWRVADATDSPEQIRAAEREVAEFKSAINQSRVAAGDPVVYP